MHSACTTANNCKACSCIHIYIYICIYVYTQTHTHTHSSIDAFCGSASCITNMPHSYVTCFIHMQNVHNTCCRVDETTRLSFCKTWPTTEVFSHLNEPCHTWMSHVTCEWCGVCHKWMRHGHTGQVFASGLHKAAGFIVGSWGYIASGNSCLKTWRDRNTTYDTIRHFRVS